MSKKLFDLPHEDKMKAPHPGAPMPHRGYSYPGFEKVYSNEETVNEEQSRGTGKALRDTMDFKVPFRPPPTCFSGPPLPPPDQRCSSM